MSGLTTDVYDQANSTWTWEIGKNKLFKSTTFILLLTCIGPKGETEVRIYSDINGKKFATQPIIEYGRKHYANANSMSFQYYDTTINNWRTYNPNSSDKLYNKIYTEMVPGLKYADGGDPKIKKEEGNFDKPLTEDDAPPIIQPKPVDTVTSDPNRQEPDVQSIYATKLAYEPSFFELAKPYIVPFGALVIGGSILWKIYHPLNPELEKLHKRTRQLQDAQRKKDQLKMEQSEAYRKKAKAELELENTKNEIGDNDDKIKKNEITEKDIKKRIKELVNNDLESKIVKKELKNLEKDMELDQKTNTTNAIDLGAVKIGANLVNTLGNVGVQAIRSTEGAVNNVITNTSNLIGTGVKAGSDVIKGAVNTTGQLVNTGLKEGGAGIRQLGSNVNTGVNKAFDATVKGIENAKDRKLEEKDMRAKHSIYDQRERDAEKAKEQKKIDDFKMNEKIINDDFKKESDEAKKIADYLVKPVPEEQEAKRLLFGEKLDKDPKAETEEAKQYAKENYVDIGKTINSDRSDKLKKNIEKTEVDLTPSKDVSTKDLPAPVLGQDFSPIVQRKEPDPIVPLKGTPVNKNPIEPQVDPKEVDISKSKIAKENIERGLEKVDKFLNPTEYQKLEDQPVIEREPIIAPVSLKEKIKLEEDPENIIIKDDPKAKIETLNKKAFIKKMDQPVTTKIDLPKEDKELLARKEGFKDENMKIAEKRDIIESSKYPYLSKDTDFFLDEITTDKDFDERERKKQEYISDKYGKDIPRVEKDFRQMMQDGVKNEEDIEKIKRMITSLNIEITTRQNQLESSKDPKYSSDDKDIIRQNNENDARIRKELERFNQIRDIKLKSMNSKIKDKRKREAITQSIINQYYQSTPEINKTIEETNKDLEEMRKRLEAVKVPITEKKN